jgi:hypothetical protein
LAGGERPAVEAFAGEQVARRRPGLQQVGGNLSLVSVF